MTELVNLNKTEQCVLHRCVRDDNVHIMTWTQRNETTEHSKGLSKRSLPNSGRKKVNGYILQVHFGW